MASSGRVYLEELSEFMSRVTIFRRQSYEEWGLSFVFRLLNPTLPSKKKEGRTGYEEGEAKDKRESPPRVFHAVHQVHTIQTGNQGGEHEDDADGRHGAHHHTHVVVDDIGVGVHRRIENVGIDIGGFACLVHLNRDVFNEVGV